MSQPRVELSCRKFHVASHWPATAYVLCRPLSALAFLGRWFYLNVKLMRKATKLN